MRRRRRSCSVVIASSVTSRNESCDDRPPITRLRTKSLTMMMNVFTNSILLCFLVCSHSLSLNSNNLQPVRIDKSTIDPYSTTARNLCTTHLGLSDDQFTQCQALCDSLVAWNTRINLVSRKDCSEAVVFTRHVLPSLCTTAAQGTNEEHHQLLRPATTVLDVGTGGGFPGLPLAIQYPQAQLTLLDSVGKKLTAVAAMAEDLGLQQRVTTHHGRVEDLEGAAVFDVVTGRAVTSLPQFCAWTQHALANDGKLLYWTGGSTKEEEDLAEQVIRIEDVLGDSIATDKKILVFSKQAVQQLGAGIHVQRSSPLQRQKKKRNQKLRIKGAWKPKDAPRQRGYENFRRYHSQPMSHSGSIDKDQ